jgi:hypothetical protein
MSRFADLLRPRITAMTKYVLTPGDIAYLRQQNVDIDATNRYVVWRGRDDVYLSKLREIYGLPNDLLEIVIAGFPEPAKVVVTVNGASGALVVTFIPCQGEKNILVESFFFSPHLGVPASLMLDVEGQPVIDATEQILWRMAPRQGGVQ